MHNTNAMITQAQHCHHGAFYNYLHKKPMQITGGNVGLVVFQQ